MPRMKTSSNKNTGSFRRFFAARSFVSAAALTRIGTLSLLGLCLACGPRSLPPLDPARIFADLERELQSRYVFTLSSASLTNAYEAAGKTLDIPGITSLEALDRALQARPREERREAIYTALRSFLQNLPEGENDFVKPESLVWSEDEDRDAGVGLVLLPQADGRFLVLDTLEGSASHRDGVPTGVHLTSVDGLPVRGLDREEVIGRIKGPADTEVRLALESGQHRLVRGKVVFRNLLNATWKTEDGGEVEYIALRSTLPGSGNFAGTAAQLKELLLPMQARKAVILDLRKLHLGDLPESFRVADLFVKDGSLGAIQSKARGLEPFPADTDQVYTGPVYVLIGTHASPQAQTVAMAMKQSPTVQLVGKSMNGNAFLASSTEVAGGIVVRLTGGYVLDATGSALFRTGLSVDFPVADRLPQKPPLKKPDPEDPAQVKVAEILGVPRS